MLRILGSRKTLCNGMTRRDLIRAGGLGMLGAVGSASAAPVSNPESFGRAKACILMFLYGSPSQLETFDMKPEAPDEIRGDMKPIRSRLAGCDVCELLPKTAQILDKTTVIRSMSHPYPIHGVAYACTGVPAIDVAMELSPHDARHWPWVGSVVDYAMRKSHVGPAREVPDNLALPFPFSSRRTGEVYRAGPYAAYLGGAYNPLWTEFRGEATGKGVYSVLGAKPEDRNPYGGITPQGKFDLAVATELPGGVTLDRLNKRKLLSEQMDGVRRDFDRSSAGRNVGQFRDMAYSLIGSRKIRDSLDIAHEPAKLRETYGMTLFGQSALAARRLVQAGSRFVTVFWDEYGLAGSGWDTHSQHFPRMKDELLPGFDAAFSGLIRDLDDQGLLDETLVCVLSEHGRTPKINKAPGGGRDHWSSAYSAVFAGGGIARGKVIGRTDRQAGTVTDRPVSPKDILATIYHLLGIDPALELRDRTNRPFPLVPVGSVVPEMLA